MKKTLNPPSHSVARPNLVLGRRFRRAQRKVSHKAQTAKTTVTNVPQPLSLDPDTEPVIQRRTMKRTLNPPSHSVVRPNLVLGRRVSMTRALTALNSGSLIAIFARAINLGHECNDNEERPSTCLPRLLAIASIRQCSPPTAFRHRKDRRNTLACLWTAGRGSIQFFRPRATGRIEIFRQVIAYGDYGLQRSNPVLREVFT